jgi:hypothetical protein
MKVSDMERMRVFDMFVWIRTWLKPVRSGHPTCYR